MQPPKIKPKTLEKFKYSQKLYAEGLNTSTVSMRSGLSRTRYNQIKAMFDAQKTA